MKILSTLLPIGAGNSRANAEPIGVIGRDVDARCFDGSEESEKFIFAIGGKVGKVGNAFGNKVAQTDSSRVVKATDVSACLFETTIQGVSPSTTTSYIDVLPLRLIHSRGPSLSKCQAEALLHAGDPIKNRCATCTQLRTEYMNNNTVMPKVCPMLKVGNGVIARPDGSIILGERVGGAEAPVWGSMIHTKAAYNRVFDCVRKNLERGHEVKLRIM